MPTKSKITDAVRAAKMYYYQNLTTSVIAKDTELKVLEQKRRWVKVANPETSESGWVYAPNLKGLPKSRGWSAQADPPDASSTSRESIWKRMRNWLTGD